MEVWFGVNHRLPYFKFGEHGYYFNNYNSGEHLSIILGEGGWAVDNTNTQDYPLVRNQMFNWE